MDFNTLPNHEKLRLTMTPHVSVYHRETRTGPTGQGHSFESLVLDKTEDNRAEADIYDTEIKTCSAKSASARVRLGTVTFLDSITNGPAAGLIQGAFGKESTNKNGETKMCFQRSIRCQKPARWGTETVSLSLDDDALRLDAGAVQAHIPRAVVEGILISKLKNLAVIKTRCRKDGDARHYNYHGFRYYDSLNHGEFWNAVKDGRIAFEFRIRGSHDHGVSVNLSLNRIGALYSQTVEWDG